MTLAPPISPELVKFLDSEFPDRAADTAFDYGTELVRVGTIKVVRYLKQLLKEQRGATEEEAAFVRLD